MFTNYPPHKLIPFNLPPNNSDRVKEIQNKGWKGLNKQILPDPILPYRTLRAYNPYTQPPRPSEWENILETGLVPTDPANTKKLTPAMHSQKSRKSPYVSFTRDRNQAAGWSANEVTAGQKYPASHYFLQATIPPAPTPNQTYYLDLTTPQGMVAGEFNPNNFHQRGPMLHNQEVLIHGTLPPPYITNIYRTHAVSGDLAPYYSLIPNQGQLQKGTYDMEGLKKYRRNKIEKLNSNQLNALRTAFPRFTNKDSVADMLNKFAKMKIVQGYSTGDTKKNPWPVMIDNIYSNPNLLPIEEQLKDPEILKTLQAHGFNLPYPLQEEESDVDSENEKEEEEEEEEEEQKPKTRPTFGGKTPRSSFQPSSIYSSPSYQINPLLSNSYLGNEEKEQEAEEEEQEALPKLRFFIKDSNPGKKIYKSSIHDPSYYTDSDGNVWNIYTGELAENTSFPSTLPSSSRSSSSSSSSSSSTRPPSSIANTTSSVSDIPKKGRRNNYLPLEIKTA